MHFFLKYKLHHVFFWCAIFLLWYYFRAQDFPSRATALTVTTVKVSVLASLIYFSSYLLLPKFLYRKKYVQFFSIYIVVIFLAGLGKLSLIMELVYPNLSVFTNFKTRVYDNLIPLFLMVSTGTTARLIKDYLVAQKQVAEIAKEKAESELKFLRSQVNPHFLFNSLNALFFLIDKQNTEARTTLLQFSDLLRYQLYECNTDKIELEKELVFLKSYIKLQKLRKDSNYLIKVDVAEDLQHFIVAPLLLIPFIENAFKHVSHHTNRTNYINISLFATDGKLVLEVENSTEDVPSASLDKVGGIGLANVKKRLQLLYPGKHDLVIDDTNNRFFIRLVLHADRAATNVASHAHVTDEHFIGTILQPGS